MSQNEFFQNITKEHIIDAIQEIDKNGIEKGAHSSTYDVVYKNKRYPPKLVVSLANKYANGEILARDTFSGGEGTPAFKLLEHLGYEIAKKSGSQSKYIRNVKKEFVKWLIDNPRVNYYNNDAEKLEKELDRYNDFFELDIYDSKRLKEIKSFLNKELYVKKTSPFLEFSEKTSRHLPRAVLGKKNYFEFLDEKFNSGMETSKSIYSWVKTHKQLSQYLLDKEGQQPALIEILKEAGATLFNDEDPAGTKIELTEIDPFTFFCYIYKYNKQRLEILQNIARNINASIPTDDSGIPSANPQKVWLFPYKYIRKNNEIERLWQFFYSALQNNISDKQFEDLLNIKGVARTKITEALFYVDPDNFFPINGPTKPYLEEVFKIDPNFNTYSEYENILNQIKTKTDKPFYQLSYEAWFWNDEIGSEERDFKNRIKKSDPDSLQIFFQFLDRFIADLNIEDSEKLVFSTGSNQLSFQIGKRYCLNLKKDKFFIIAPKDYVINNLETGLFAEPDAASWYNKVTNDEVIKHYDAVSKAVQFEIQRDNYTNEKEYDNKVFRRAVFDRDYRNKYFESDYTKPETVDKENKVLNRILFGPPGTGKTYHTINHALEICGEDLTGLDRPEIKRRYNQRVKDGQIVFITFHQSMSYEDFIEGIKPLEPEEEGGQVIYKIVDGIFKKACIEAAFNFAEEHASDQKEMQLDFSLAYDQFKEQTEEELALENQVILKTKSGGNIYVDGITSQGNMLIKHKDGVRAYVVSKHRLSKLNKAISDLEAIPNIYGTFGKIIGGSNASAYWAILNAIRRNKNIPEENKQIQREYSWEDKNDVVQSLDSEIFKVKAAKPVVVIIDEINRGNVSSIFGELITLIETDKRLGQAEQLLNVLPYSKEPFGVPPNLYIIGTMNTADRSVEALDTALRRRFSFKEMAPTPGLIRTEGNSGKTNGIVDGINLSSLLQTINTRIEKLIDKDHKIGHSYFLKVNSKEALVHCFENEVIPLLEEYFFGDYGKIGLVLGDSFVVKDETEAFEFAEFEGYDADVSSDLKERSVYKIRPSKEWDFNNI